MTLGKECVGSHFTLLFLVSCDVITLFYVCRSIASLKDRDMQHKLASEIKMKLAAKH